MTISCSRSRWISSSNIYKHLPRLTPNGFFLLSTHSLRPLPTSMRLLLTSHHLTRPILSLRMGSITAPREFRTLAQCPHLAISEAEDDLEIRRKYRPFLLDPSVESTDWISHLELDTVLSISSQDLSKTRSRLKVLVLYGSLRKRYLYPLSQSHLAYEP